MPAKQPCNYETVQANCQFRAKLWREFLRDYVRQLDESPETFSEYCAEFRKRFLRGHAGS